METLDGGVQTPPSYCTGTCTGTMLTETCTQSASGVTFTSTTTLTFTSSGGATGTTTENIDGVMCSYTLAITKD
jgi:hypothetical protein